MPATTTGSNGTSSHTPPLDRQTLGRTLGGLLTRTEIPAEARHLLARAEQRAAKGLRIAAKQLDHAAFRLDCASRRLSPKGAKSSPDASKQTRRESPEDESMDDELLSPHLA